MSRVVDALDGGALRLLVPVLAAGARLRLPLSNEKAKRELGWRPAYPTPGSALDAARELAGPTGGGSTRKGGDEMADAWSRRRPRVGQRAERSRLVRPDDIRLFTEMSGDRNPLHYDETAARASRFGEIVVQGGVTSAILNAVVAEDLPGPGTVFLHVDWRFTAPVRPGDTITGAVEVLEVREDKPVTKLATSVRRQDGVVALEGTAVCYTMDV